MKKFQVNIYQILPCGEINIEAENKEIARDMVFNLVREGKVILKFGEQTISINATEIEDKEQR